MRVLCIIFLPLEQPHKIGAVMPSGRRVFEDDRMILGVINGEMARQEINIMINHYFSHPWRRNRKRCGRRLRWRSCI
jgi:hypothetical protein